MTGSQHHQRDPVALVTGAARGLGRAITEALIKAGHRVVLVDKDHASAKAAAADLGDDWVLAVQCDVTADDQVARAVASAQDAYGGLDVLVCNAGTTDPAPTQTVESSDWWSLIDVHLGGTFRFAREAYPLLAVSPRAAIVAISSVTTTRAIPARASYAAAKGGIEALTRTLAVEWAASGIRVNAVAPGFISTEGAAAIYDAGMADPAERRRAVPLDRLGVPSDIANAVVWLASNDAGYITGQVLTVDGGFTVDGRTGTDVLGDGS